MKTLATACLALIALTTASDARPGATCAKVCQRLSSCKLLSYRFCLDECDRQGAEDRPESRAENLAQARMSCSALASHSGGSRWMCIAEGATAWGYDMDSSVPDERGTHDIYMNGTGPTRSAAASRAISACNSAMTVQLSLDTSSSEPRSGGAIATSCHVTQCIPPSSARSQRQR